MRKSYNDYYKRVIELLIEHRTWTEDGIWRATGKPLAHILPVDYIEDSLEYRNNRADAISNYVNLNCRKCLGDKLIGLHQFAHHLTSSQQLCMKFFSELIDDNRCATEEMVDFMNKAFGIDIHVGAECCFEYTVKKAPYLFDVDNEGNLIKGYEGTSFDFHIKDGSVEIYFEIKFTEQGFKKETEDKRHLAKAAEYLRIAPQFLRDLVATPKDFLKQYQIYRNIVRATDSNKYVVFISDANNPATEDDKEMMQNLGLPKNIIFKTWQQIIPVYPYELPFQLKAIQNYK